MVVMMIMARRWTVVLLSVVVAAMMLTSGLCQLAPEEKLNERCKYCIAQIAKYTAFSEWDSVENCLHWTADECKFLKEHKQTVMGVFFALMNPYSYASGLCLARNCEHMSWSHEVDTTPLTSPLVVDFVTKLLKIEEAATTTTTTTGPASSAAAAASSIVHSALDKENHADDADADDDDDFLADDDTSSSSAKVSDKCTKCWSDSFNFMKKTIVPRLLDDLCTAGKQKPDTLVSYVKYLMCIDFNMSPPGTLSYFTVVDSLYYGAFGACKALGCEP